MDVHTPSIDVLLGPGKPHHPWQESYECLITFYFRKNFISAFFEMTTYDDDLVYAENLY